MTTKHDSGKWRFSLVPFKAMRSIIAVLEFGAQKYAPDNWKTVPDARTRYYDAAIRHLTAWFSGEKLDQESGENHLAHAACCIMFLLWFDTRNEPFVTFPWLKEDGWCEVEKDGPRDYDAFHYVEVNSDGKKRVYAKELS